MHNPFKIGAPQSNVRGLHIMIVGGGKVGGTLVEQLCKEGHDITVIDTDPDIIASLTNTFDIMGMTGNGASYSVQIEAGIADTDLFIAVTGSDELNLLCCTVAKQVADCAAIARVRTPDYSKESAYLREKLGLAMIINPELETAREAGRILLLPTALDVGSFAHGQAEMVKFKIPEGNKLDGMTLIDVSQHIESNVLVCIVERDGGVNIPSGKFELKSGDVISFVSTPKIARSFLTKIGFNVRQVKNAMIVGGGRAAYYLGNQLLRSGIDVKIIEQDKKRCEELSILLPKAIIINGDGSDEDLLREEGIDSVEAFIPLTGIDEENIILTLFARQFSNAKVITKINRINFRSVIGKLDLGSILFPKYITSEAIIAYVRGMSNTIGRNNLRTLYYLVDRKAEALEFEIEEESAITSKPLMELSLKSSLLIAGIIRKGKIIIPSGSDMICVGDIVIIVTAHMGFNDITDILA
ncbi:MAG: Trk system potassium transporter TrkA [Lachnospiraceae bacterium]|nr:Trk system potassium transporter TrkA [Lachnospiraceae bacterium]